MKNSQKGFGAVEGLLILVILGIIGFVGWYVYTHMAGMSSNNDQGSLKYKSEHFGLNLSRESDDNLKSAYSLDVSFYDSLDPHASCPSQQAGFKDNIDISAVSDQSAVIIITQNKKPYKPSAENAVTCSIDIGVLPLEDKHTFDRAWIENGQNSKTLMVQGRKYTLMLDKENYKLSLSDSKNTAATAYLPDGIGALYTYPACKTLNELKVYANDNDIKLADAKYPGIEQKLMKLGGSETNTGPYDQSLLVIANDYFKNLLKQKGVDETCKVWASKSPVNASLGNDIVIE